MTQTTTNPDFVPRASAASTVNPWAVLAVIGVPVFLGSLDLTVVSAFLPTLFTELELSTNTENLGNIAWLLTSYLLAYTIALFTMGRVSDLIGRRRALVLSLSVYMLGAVLFIIYPLPTSLLMRLYEALGVEIASNQAALQAITLARAVAALGAGAIPAIAIGLVGDLFPAGRRAVPLGVVMATDTVGWLLGAAWGGFVVQFFPWRALFLINLPLVLMALILAWWSLRAVKLPRVEGRLDIMGIVLLSLTLLALNLGLVRLTSGETSVNVNATLPYLGATLVAGFVFVLNQRSSAQPLIDLRLFAGRTLSAATLLNLLIGFAMFVPLVSIPLFINIRHMDDIGFAGVVPSIRDLALRDASLETGLLMAAFTLPLAVASVVGGRLMRRFAASGVTLVGLVLALVGFALSAWLLANGPGLIDLALLMMFTGVGLGLTFTPVINATVQSVSEARRGMASAVVLGMRMVGVTVATSALSAFGTQRVIDLVTAVEQGRLFFDITAPENYAVVFSTTYFQASLQMLAEMAFFGLAACLIALPFALLMPRRRVAPLADIQERSAA